MHRCFIISIFMRYFAPQNRSILFVIKMKIVTTIAELHEILCEVRKLSRSIGLVPTMGALHEGHASLVRRSVKENDVTVVSIFLNPTQFNDSADLERYPRTLDADCRLLEICGADIAFAPSVEEIYPEPDSRKFSYPPTDTVMEGAYRPGHFNGVCQIVSKLFLMVEPKRAYFGEKDYQQIAVIRRMVADLALPVEIVPCPVVREQSGLALSSRNSLLSDEERKTAAHIYQTLNDSRQLVSSHSVQQVRDWVIDQINKVPELHVQYFSIVNGDTLADVDIWNQASHIVGCITVFCGETPIRLIDHVRYV